MAPQSFSRRDFMAAASAAATLPFSTHAAEQSASAPWPIGCVGRPFRKWSIDEALDAMKTAGFQLTGMLGPVGGRSPLPTPDALAALKEQLARHGMKTNVGSLEVRAGVPLTEAVAHARQQIANAHTLGQQFALSYGVEQESEFVQYCKVMSDAAAFGQERGVQVVLKPHHGLNNTAGELLGFVTAINHPNFTLWYDAGNIVYYTGKDPVAQLEIVAPYLTGMIVKDCSAPQYQERVAGAPPFGASAPDPAGNEVMIWFGTGKVDFASMFRKLKGAGFKGPLMIEGVPIGATLQETTESARRNREFLAKVTASV